MIYPCRCGVLVYYVAKQKDSEIKNTNMELLIFTRNINMYVCK